MWDTIIPAAYEDAVYGNPLLIAVFEAEVEYMAHLLSPASVLLEVGCGSGKFCLSFVRRLSRIIGVDTSSIALDFLRKKDIFDEAIVRLVCGDAAQLNSLLASCPDLAECISRRHVVAACVMNTLGIMPAEVRPRVMREMLKAVSGSPRGEVFVVVFNSEFFEQGVLNFYAQVPRLCGAIKESDINWATADISVASTGYRSHWFSEGELSNLLCESGVEGYSITRMGIALLAVGRASSSVRSAGK